MTRQYWKLIGRRTSFISNIFNVPCNTMKQTPVKQEESSSPSAPHPHQSTQGNARVFAKMGQWDKREKTIYLQFLKEQRDVLERKDPAALRKAFRDLGHQVGTRKPNQCRLYHQKMQRYYQSLPNLIHCLSQHLRPQKEEEPSLQQALSQDHLQPQQPSNLPDLLHEDAGWTRRRATKKLSIKLPEDEAEDCSKDQELPKTDQSIPILPQMQTPGMMPERSRPSLPFNFAESVACPSGSAFFLPYSPFPLFPQYPLPETSFRYDLVQSSSASDWLECQSFFLAWQQRSRQLQSSQTSKQ